ncbi:MAG: AraC family transcriptional regulator [Bacteroidia bacterium]
MLAIKSSVLLLSFSGPFSRNLHSDERFEQYMHRLFRSRAGEASKPNRSKASLEPEEADRIREELLMSMAEEELFLNPDLSLRSLAARVGVHPNQLSWLLNALLEQNFNQFVNAYRINHFKKLVADKSNAHISLLGLAYESGFNSKSVFNAAFKKACGMTPGAFVKSLK